ncbi:MAG: DUF4340 domain-containing protein [Alphaproteobacteria bacterium]|nr:DUF4340 domain-containing protein [Alphaproteobacteria bacterium]MCY4230438.1 DUF4340 domain-containing protein [Alphaproteobacteria bacterium]MCY4319707.1 DUF4340 domain-containing protein [Alphaproteobacteria bacterium]
MKLRSFLFLLVLTAATAAAAIAVLVDERIRSSDPVAGAMLYPGLLDRVNDIDFVEVSTMVDGTVSARREDGRWAVAQRHGYPADFDMLKRMLYDLARIELIEPRTSRPALYPKIRVEDLGDNSAESIRIVAKIGEETVADLLVGLARPEETGGGVFLRKSGEAQSWLAKGGFQPVQLLTRFLDRNIANVEQRRIYRTHLIHADGETVTVSRAGPEEMAWILEEPPPPGHKAKAGHELSPLTSWLDFLIFDDVRPAAEVDFSKPLVTGRFETFDGLVVEADMAAQDGSHWVALAASPGAPDPRVQPLLDARRTMEAGKLEGSLQMALKTPDEVATEIDEINATAGGWAYRVTDYKTDKFRTRLADVTEAGDEN